MAISNAVVSVLRVHAGKGPTQAKTYYHGDRFVIVLHGWMTTAEKTLVELGRNDLVVEARHDIHSYIADGVRERVRMLTHRTAMACHSEFDLDSEQSIVTVRLDRQSSSADSRASHRLRPRDPALDE